MGSLSSSQKLYFKTQLANEKNNQFKNGNQFLNGTYHLINTIACKWEKQRIKFFIEETPFGEIKYIHDGEILRIENLIDQEQKLKPLTNFEQIKNLKWVGQFGNQNLKIGMWQMIWKGEKQIVGGNYNYNGIKEGKWVELFEEFWDLCQIFFVGMYVKGLRQGNWVYQQEEGTIGGGYYNQNGEKNGYWIELHDNFNKNCKVTLQGEYKNNKKYGNWVYQFRESSQIKCKNIPGGIYNKDGLKHGKWIDLWHAFDCDLQYLFIGEYILGKKQGNWNTMEIKFREQYQIIGCGVYDEIELENGNWLEFNKSQRYFYHDIISSGQYVHGRKIGTWNTLIKDQLVGIGSYNQEGKRNGKWIHFPKRLQFETISLIQYEIKDKLITFEGEYKNGVKKGNWKIKKGNEIIGGGEYNDEGLKNGNWNDIWNFKLSCFVIQRGEYQKGIRQGKWETLYKIIQGQKKLEKIGEGIYDNQGMKHGKWISLHDNFNYNCQVLDVGYYHHGTKQGRWDFKTVNYYEHNVLTFPFWPKDTFEKIAGGNFKDGVKIGKWIELYEFYRYHLQILYEGEYNNDLKKGKWEMMKHHNQKIKRIGGGYFDNDSFKNSKWIELDLNCKLRLKIVDYQNGIVISTQKIQKGI